jgi:hypothetical protein
VFDIAGRPVKVAGIAVLRDCPTVMVTTSSATRILCSDEQQFITVDVNGETVVQTAKSIMKKRQVANSDTVRIPQFVSDAEFECHGVELEPWALGVIISCGVLHMDELTIATDKPLVAHCLGRYLHADVKEQFPQEYVFIRHGFPLKLREVCDFTDDEIEHYKLPERYVINSREKRIELMCGIFDVIGTLTREHYRDTNLTEEIYRISAVCRTPDLGGQMRFIMQSLGKKCFRVPYLGTTKLEVPCNFGDAMKFFKHVKSPTERVLAGRTQSSYAEPDKTISILSIDYCKSSSDMVSIRLVDNCPVYLTTDFIPFVANQGR